MGRTHLARPDLLALDAGDGQVVATRLQRGGEPRGRECVDLVDDGVRRVGRHAYRIAARTASSRSLIWSFTSGLGSTKSSSATTASYTASATRSGPGAPLSTCR